MKKLASVVLLIWMSLAAIAQESEVRQIGPFKGIRSSEAIDVYLKKGEKESVKVVVDGTSLSNVLTEVSGSYLKIHMREGNYRNRNVKVYVTYVSLEKISASSASNVFSEGTIKSGTLEINAASAGSVELALDAGEVTVDVASAGNITLEGKAKSLIAEASSAGSLDAYGLDTEIVNVTASSAGSAKVSASKELEAEASSGGSIKYRGSPLKTNTDSSSGGSVKKSN
jgi:hypothetical protein